MTNKEYEGAVECLITRLCSGNFSVESLVEWMVEHDVEPTLAEDMVSDVFRTIAGRSLEVARVWVGCALDQLEQECAAPDATVN